MKLFISCLASLFLQLVSGDSVSNKYIVTFNRNNRIDFDSQVASVTDLFIDRSSINQVHHKYDAVLKGIAVTLDSQTLAKVKELPNVDSVSPDGIITLDDVQTNAPWGLARVSQRGKLTSATKSTYTYNPNAGLGVHVYVVDTGIYLNHTDFEGRAKFGVSFQSGQDGDGHSHGTHCAGTVGSKTYGVAKKATLIAVKVLDNSGSGSNSDMIAGLNWVAKNANGPKGNVVSMSLGSGVSAEINQAVDDATAKGIVVVVSGGNNNFDACKKSPASAKTAITVGATDVNDAKASFSNYGKCIKILAPGVDVVSTANKPTGTSTKSGTSMACPHVAGLAATLLSEGVSASDVLPKLLELGTKGVITGFSNDTPNVLGHNGQ